ncbi:MAG: universal stress protein [Syntrophorhabdaceae bacterium]|nr:universal stress protein [Syntrophorhabdaceae bacterium]
MNILLPVSNDPSFKDALALAIDVAKVYGATIRVLYVIDQSEIRRIEGGVGLGSIHMAQHAAEETERRKMAEATEILSSVSQACANAGVQSQGDIREGKPAEEFIASSGGHDLVVGAINSHFNPDMKDKPGKMILKIMRDGGIPILLACTPYRPIQTVVIGCGGRFRTERVVGAMTKLSLWKSGCRGILLTVADSPEDGEERIAMPQNLLANAGYGSWEPRVINGRKQEAFSDYCEKENVDLAVLGGWGEHRWTDLLGFSITGCLLNEGRRNLFLYM